MTYGSISMVAVITPFNSKLPVHPVWWDAVVERIFYSLRKRVAP